MKARQRDVAVLSGDDLWPRLVELAQRRRRGPGVCVVAYLTEPLLDLRAGDTLAVDISADALATGATNPAALRGYLDAGVSIHAATVGTHAKVYVLGDVAVIGSANSSRNSRDRLREVAVELHDPAAITDVTAAAIALLGRPLDHDDLDAAQRAWRPPRRTRLPHRSNEPAESTPTPDDRLWILSFELSTRPVEVEERVTARATPRRRPGVIHDDMWCSSAAAGIAVGDMVVSVGEDESVSPPGRVTEVRRVGGRSAHRSDRIVWWDYPADTEWVPWSDLVDATAPHRTRLAVDLGSAPGVRLVRNRAARAAIYALFDR